MPTTQPIYNANGQIIQMVVVQDAQQNTVPSSVLYDGTATVISAGNPLTTTGPSYGSAAALTLDTGTVSGRAIAIYTPSEGGFVNMLFADGSTLLLPVPYSGALQIFPFRVQKISSAGTTIPDAAFWNLS